MNIDFGSVYIPDSTLASLSCSGSFYSLLMGSIYTPNEPKCFENAAKSHGLLFTGICGSGKRRTIDSFAGTAGDCGYELFEVSVIDLWGDDHNSTITNIKSFFENVYRFIVKEECSVFLYFEDISLFNDDTRSGMIFFSRLKKLLKTCPYPIIAVGAYDDVPSNIPDIYRASMQIVNIEMPNTLDRTNIFNETIDTLLNEEVTCEYLVKVTSDFTKGEIMLLIDSLFMMSMGDVKEISENSYSSYYFDDIDSDSLLTKMRVEMLVKWIKENRYVPKEPKSVKSVFNYPNSGGTIVMASDSVIQADSGNSSGEAVNEPVSKVNADVLSTTLMTANANDIVNNNKKAVHPYDSLNESLPDI